MPIELVKISLSALLNQAKVPFNIQATDGFLFAMGPQTS